MVFYNRTRVSASIPRRLAAEGKFHLLPLYYVLTGSDLAKEGIQNSGSWRFADHIYRGEPAGRGVAGRTLDALLMALPSAASFRERYRFVRDELVRRLPALAASADREVRVASVPSGIPRDLVEAAAALDREGLLGGVRFTAVDLDPEPLDAAKSLASDAGVAASFDFVCADAFDAGAYPQPLDVLTSTGFGEFLTDTELLRFLELGRTRLVPGGLLLTSATGRHRLSDYVMRELAELRAHYRTQAEIGRLLSEAGFEGDSRVDRRGLQTLVVARAGAEAA